MPVRVPKRGAGDAGRGAACGGLFPGVSRLCANRRRGGGSAHPAARAGTVLRRAVRHLNRGGRLLPKQRFLPHLWLFHPGWPAAVGRGRSHPVRWREPPLPHGRAAGKRRHRVGAARHLPRGLHHQSTRQHDRQYGLLAHGGRRRGARHADSRGEGGRRQQRGVLGGGHHHHRPEHHPGGGHQQRDRSSPLRIPSLPSRCTASRKAKRPLAGKTSGKRVICFYSLIRPRAFAPRPSYR